MSHRDNINQAEYCKQMFCVAFFAMVALYGRIFEAEKIVNNTDLWDQVFLVNIESFDTPAAY